MRYAPGKVPARPLPAAPSRPTIQQQVAGTRPVGAVRPKVGPFGGFSGDPKPAPQIAAMNNMLTGRPPGGVPAPQAGAMNNMLAGKPPGGMKKGGKVSSASKRADGCAVKGKTKGKMV
jgi:hypothetical protein